MTSLSVDFSRTQGTYASIDEAKLSEVCRISGISADKVLSCIDYDFPNIGEHQAWLDAASAAEIANWLPLEEDIVDED